MPDTVCGWIIPLAKLADIHLQDLLDYPQFTVEQEEHSGTSPLAEHSGPFPISSSPHADGQDFSFMQERLFSNLLPGH